MALDQEDLGFISLDLAHLCQYEVEEATSGRNAERDLKWFGSPLRSAVHAKKLAERHLELLPRLKKKSTLWHDDFVRIRDYVRQLDDYIAEQDCIRAQEMEA